MTNEQPPSDPYGSPDPAGPEPAPGYPAPATDPGSIDPTLEQPTIPPPGGPVPPADGPTEPTDGSGRRVGLIVAIVILLLVVIAAGVGLALNRKDSSSTATAGTTPATQVSDAGRTAGGEIEQPAGATTTNAASNTTAKAPVTTAPSTPTAPPTKAPTSAPTTTAPSVTFASATNNPTHLACPDPSLPGYTSPTVTISWNAPGAKTVALSVDGPGVYDTYNGPTGSVTLGFSCTLNTQGQHTYLLTATAADGQKATKTLTTTWQ